MKVDLPLLRTPSIGLEGKSAQLVVSRGDAEYIYTHHNPTHLSIELKPKKMHIHDDFHTYYK